MCICVVEKDSMHWGTNDMRTAMSVVCFFVCSGGCFRRGLFAAVEPYLFLSTSSCLHSGCHVYCRMEVACCTEYSVLKRMYCSLCKGARDEMSHVGFTGRVEGEE